MIVYLFITIRQYGLPADALFGRSSRRR